MRREDRHDRGGDLAGAPVKQPAILVKHKTALGRQPPSSPTSSRCKALPILVALPVGNDDIVQVAHDGLRGGVCEAQGAGVVWLGEGIARREFVEAAPVDAYHDPRIGQDRVGLLEATHVFVPGEAGVSVLFRAFLDFEVAVASIVGWLYNH